MDGRRIRSSIIIIISLFDEENDDDNDHDDDDNDQDDDDYDISRTRNTTAQIEYDFTTEHTIAAPPHTHSRRLVYIYQIRYSLMDNYM